MIPTFLDIIQWYNQNVPQMASFLSDDAIITKFRDRYDIRQDFVDLWMASTAYPQDPEVPEMSTIEFNMMIHDYESRYKSGDDTFDKQLLDRYSPLLMLCLFSDYGKVYTYNDPSQWEGLPVPTAIDRKMLDYFNQWMHWEGSNYREDLEWRAPSLPMWMQYRKTWRIGTKLAYVNCVLDKNWIYSGDIPEPANLLSIAPYYTLDNVPLWGDLLTSAIKYHNNYSEEEMIVRHNLFVNKMAELLSFRPLWSLSSGTSGADFKRLRTGSISNVEKQAAYFFLQFILYARLIVRQKADRKKSTTLPFMHEFHKSATWRYVLMKYSTSQSIRGTWLWNPGYFRRTCIAGASSYPYLGDGVLITNMWFHVVGNDKFNSNNLIMNAGQGLLNDDMIEYLRAIHLAQTPALMTKYAGLINPPNPESSPIQNRNGSTKEQMAPYINEADLAGGGGYSHFIYWSPKAIFLADDTATNANAILNTSQLYDGQVADGSIKINYQRSRYYHDMMSLPAYRLVNTQSFNIEEIVAQGLG